MISERRIGSRYGRTRPGPRALPRVSRAAGGRARGRRDGSTPGGGTRSWPSAPFFRPDVLVRWRCVRPEPCLGGVALLACAATWGVLLALMAA